MRYVFPAVFEPSDEGGFVVSVPDIEGCFTEGETLAEAMFMAQDALAMMLVYHEDNNKAIPDPTPLNGVKASDGSIVSLVLADTDQWRRTFDKGRYSSRNAYRNLLINFSIHLEGDF